VICCHANDSRNACHTGCVFLQGIKLPQIKKSNSVLSLFKNQVSSQLGLLDAFQKNHVRRIVHGSYGFCKSHYTSRVSLLLSHDYVGSGCPYLLAFQPFYTPTNRYTFNIGFCFSLFLALRSLFCSYLASVLYLSPLCPLRPTFSLSCRWFVFIFSVSVLYQADLLSAERRYLCSEGFIRGSGMNQSPTFL
jgi:hypothetical protein